MKRMFGLLMTSSLFCIHSYAQTYQLEEDQRLSTFNTPMFSNIILQHHTYPQVIFRNTSGGIDRPLYSDGLVSGQLKYRYDGTNDGVMLHSANFNGYAPTLTGTGASGNWNISIIGSARQWGDQTYLQTDGPVNSYILGFGSDGNWHPTGPNFVRSWLGIPTGGETFQSVTDRDNVTNNVLQVTGIGHGKTNTLGLELDYNGYGDNRGRVFSYDRVNNIYKGLRLEGSDLIINAASGGNVGIGTTSPSEKLSVNGNIRSRKIIVTQTGWADYVFDSSYQLTPLHQVEKYIQQNKHLPDVPSAAEVEKDGVDLGDNQAVLLKKIEELTLYIIEQNKKLEAVCQEVKALKGNRK